MVRWGVSWVESTSPFMESSVRVEGSMLKIPDLGFRASQSSLHSLRRCSVFSFWLWRENTYLGCDFPFVNTRAYPHWAVWVLLKLLGRSSVCRFRPRSKGDEKQASGISPQAFYDYHAVAPQLVRRYHAFRASPQTTKKGRAKTIVPKKVLYREQGFHVNSWAS